MSEGTGPPPGYGAPQPPRPGIIPLRPLELDDLLGGALRYVWTHKAATMIPPLLTSIVVVILQFSFQPAYDPAVPFPSFTELIVDSTLATIPLIVLAYLIYPPMLAVQMSVLVPAILGRRLSLGEAWTAARAHLKGMYVAYLVIGLVGIVTFAVGLGLAVLLAQLGGVTGFLLAALFVLASYAVWVWLLVILWPSIPALVVEGLDARAAIERARGLVRGAWWRLFGFQLAAGLVVVIASMVIFIPAVIAGTIVQFSSVDGLNAAAAATPSPGYFLIIGVASVVISTVATAYLLGFGGLLYVDQRIRRERYDLDLAAQAGD